MPTKRIIVTGGSGKAGHWIIKHLIEEGYEVVNVDSRQPKEPQCRTIIADLTQLGQVVTSFSPSGTGNRAPYDGIIHFAAIPRPHESPNEEVFRINSMSTYNVLEAASLLGIQKAVIASSESIYGACFSTDYFPPQYLPLDEEHPVAPEDSYGLSKIVNEETAAAFHRRSGMQITSFRLGNILGPEDYEAVRATFAKPEYRLRNLWSYIDARDVAVACRLGIEKNGLGCNVVILTADDVSSDRDSLELAKEFLPTVTHFKKEIVGRSTLLSNAKAKELLGWQQQYYIV